MCAQMSAKKKKNAGACAGCNLAGLKHWRLVTGGAAPRGGIRLNPGTCPGKRPDVTGIKTTHTPCQTVGRMDGWSERGSERRGVIKKKRRKGKSCRVQWAEARRAYEV